MKIMELVLITCVLHFLVMAQQNVQSVVISTKNGEVEGTQFTTAEMNRVYYAFMGIPYAKSPTGTLRFQPPQPSNNWIGVRNATYERDVCVQTIINTTEIVGSEDCLFLNIFTTQLPKGNRPSLPVMFWIHGGAFIFGSGNKANQEPDYLLDSGVLVVTINYRLGAFGWLSTGDLVVPGNNGLKDQNMALLWVRENIANFGGDPNKVTIFGQSAGSVAVSYLLQSNLAEGLYHRAIMQSGTTLCPWSLTRNARKVAFKIGKRLSIDTNNTNILIHKLKSIDYVSLQRASLTIGDLISLVTQLNGLDFGPVKEVEHAGAVFTSKSHESLQNGHFNRVPILLGFNSEEANAYIPFYKLLGNYLEIYDTQVDLLVPLDMNIVHQPTNVNVGHLIHTYYGGSSGTMALPGTGFIRYCSDNEYVRPIRQYTKLASRHVNTYYYRFSYIGDLANPDRGNYTGVAHSEELSYLFRMGTLSDNANPSDVILRKRIVKLWTNFAKFGNPTPVADVLLQNVIWPVASKTENLTYLDIGYYLNVRTKPCGVNMNFWDAIYTIYSIPPYDTY